MALLEGKTALVSGVANKRSIGWAIAQALSDAGARLAFTYQTRMEKMVRELVETVPNDPLLIECDVQSDEELDRAFSQADEAFGGLDILVHSVAFAPPAELEGRFLDTSREGFKNTLDISAYSLVAMAKRAEPLMAKRGGGSIVCLTYMASERVFPKYNVMAVAKAALECSTRYLAYELGPQNIRVNAISAGPLNTLAARGVKGFTDMLTHQEQIAPLHRNIEQADVGALALFLCSPAARNITGGVHFVDAGFNIMGI
ncbi:MAG TPA: enoyl-ACP reductase [Ktedonobacterales bacterium]|nr:enoyl-ACP reductase [Ktedonobacterales bacterium]